MKSTSSSLLFVFLIVVSRCELIEITRSTDGDSISGKSVAGKPIVGEYCVDGVGGGTSCQCPEERSTVLTVPEVTCGGDEEVGCELQADIGDGAYTLLYTAGNASTYLINVTKPQGQICANPDSNVTFSPIFVQDYQNILNWNPVFGEKVKSRITGRVFDAGKKVELNITSHWTGLLLKIYIKCGPLMGECISIKFTGHRTYPLTEEIVKSVIGIPTPPSTSSLVTSSLMTSQISSSLVISPFSPLATSTITVPTITTSLSASQMEITPTPSMIAPSSSLLSVSVTQSLPPPPSLGESDDGRDHIIISVVVVIIIIIIIIVIVYVLVKRKRNRKKELPVEEKQAKSFKGTTTNQASVRSLNSITRQQRITSNPDILNSDLYHQPTVENPLYQTDIELSSGITSPSSQSSVSPMSTASEGGGSDNFGYSS